MSESKRLYAILLGAVLIAGISLGIVLTLHEGLFGLPSPDDPEIIVEGSTAINVTLGEMLQMDSITRNGSFQNSFGNIKGEGLYTGVRVSDLIELAGGMEQDDNITVIASDGYNQSFPFDKVYPNQTFYDLQGDMVLAFRFDGNTVPEYADGFRLVFLPEDEYYSNADANATSASGFAYAGPQCVTNVLRIVIDSAEPIPTRVTQTHHEDDWLQCSQSNLFLHSDLRFELSNGNLKELLRW